MRVEHWTNAVEQAQAAVARLLDGPDAAKPFDPVPYVWSDQYDTTLAVAGRPRAGDDVRVVTVVAKKSSPSTVKKVGRCRRD
jgi:3-phenylpropionate/trans-cinnamate dioxygenase ferredoxin reductase subunit